MGRRMKGENPRLSVVAPPDVNARFREKANARGLTIKDALLEAIDVWDNAPTPALPPEFPNDMEPKERKIAANIIRGRRLSKIFANGIDALINILPDVKQD